MYVIALKGTGKEGLYAVESERGEKVLYFFLEYDDAYRFVCLLEANDYPDLEVVEVEDRMAIKICEENDYTYLIVTPEDLIIPPDYHDNFQKD